MRTYTVLANQAASKLGADKQNGLQSIVRRVGAQALLLALLAPGMASAQMSNTPPIYNIDQTCVGSVQRLGCTANDVSVALVNTSGNPIVCVATPAGATVSLNLSAQWQSTASERYNLGVWIATDGGDPSIPSTSTGGSAHCDIFGTPITPAPWGVTGTNVCGNLASATAGPSTTYNLPHTVDVPCVPNAAGQLVLLNVATWDQSGGTCTTATDINAGTSSKCKTGNFTANVIGSLIIKKVATGAGGQTFPFTTNVTTPPSFTLGDTGQRVVQTDAALTATAQTVTVTEGATAGWSLSSISCTDFAGKPNPSYVTVNQATGQVSAALNGTNYTATCTYTNTNTATVNVSKQVTGPIAGYVAASTFPITVNCGSGHTQTFNLINTGSASLTSVPPGAACTVTEGTLPAAAANYAYGTPSISNNSFTAAAGVTVSSIVTNPVSRLTSSITLTKILSGAPAGGAPGTYDFSANCGTDGTFTGTVVLGSGVTTNTGTITGIPAGAVCSVSETSVAAAPTNYVFGTLPSAVPLTTTSGGPNNASFTNTLTRLTSTITINKMITGGPSGGTAATFGYTTTCDAGGPFSTNVTTVASSGSNTVASVPAGAACTVTETTVPAAPTNYAYGTTPAAVPVTTTVAGPNTANFTNVLTRQTGSLTVTKAVTGPSGGTALVTGSFPFSVNCGVDGTFTGSVAITGGVTNSTSVSPINAGASCTVTETGTAAAPTGYTWNAATYATNPVSIPVNAAATLTITNPLAALAAGSISVAKAVVGGPVPSGSFSITVACPAATGILAYSSTQTVTGGNTVIFTGVPQPNASDCSVTESSTLPTPPTNYDWNAANTPPAPLTSVSVGDSVTVTNTLVRQTSTITVNKTVTGGPSGGVTGTFNFTADCTASSDGTYTGSIALSGATGGSTSITSVPAGANCTVSEGALPTSPQYYTWGTTPPAVTFVTTNAGPNTASFTNTLTRDPSTVEIDKTVTGGPAAGVSGAFTFTVDCTASSDGTYPGTITLTSATSGNTTVTSVPAGANCTVSEATVPTAPAGYSWGTMPANVPLTPTEAGPNVASFTNTLTRQPSTITVNKTVVGGPAGGVSGAFDFSVDCATDGTFSGTVILAAATSGSVAIGVPANATCTVSETSVPGAPSNYAWGATPPVVTLTTTMAGPNTANFTNPLNSTFVPVTIPVPTLRGWQLLLLGAMLLLMGVYVQQRRAKD